MKSKDLRKLTDEKLLEKKKELELEILGSYAKVHPTIKPEQKRIRKKTIARINTILHERGWSILNQ